MIVASAKGKKGKKEIHICILGLTTANFNKMLAGQPIHVKGDTHPGALPDGWELMIFHGQTEEDIRQLFEQHKLIGPNTKLIIDPRLEIG